MRIRGLAVALAGVLLLAGCVPAPAADPMNDQLRAGIQQRRADQAWRSVAEQYPEARRPDVIAGAVVPGFERISALASCYRTHGLAVDESPDGIAYGPSAGMSQLDFEVTQYECAVQVVDIDEVARQLDDYQLGALYDYYVTKLRPCLQFTGLPSSDPPHRDDFIIQVYATLWSPYDDLTRTNPDTADLVSIAQRCPALPGWLHL